MLVCTSCSSALAITLNSKLSANTFDKICQAYRNKIVTCHATSCPFRLPSIKQLESLESSEKDSDNVETDAEQARLNVPVYMSQVLPEESVRLMEHPKPSVILRKNAKKLSDVVRSISCVANKNTTEAPSSSSWSFPRLQIPSKIRQMNSSMELTKHLDCDDESILALSLLGWGPIPNICLDNAAPVVSLGCPCCFSILDLRLEHKIGDDSGTLEVDDENETDRFTKRQRISSRHLNPLEAHRHYCPYKVGFPEKAGHSNPLWKTILKRLGEECRHGEIEESTSIEEISAGVDVSILDESVGNVRRMLRAGIATKNVDLVVWANAFGFAASLLN